MNEFIYIGIIIILFVIISILEMRIERIKNEHKIKLAELYRKLSDITRKEKDSFQKLQLNQDLNHAITDAKKRLNEEIFDLQMEVFSNIKNIDY
ncbi:MAG: hypothetical protein DI529_07110 [Chryseobacterium sp.]|nr:MAG: hypothetical protein DI529_07110 [Chryseobacterium sp.]